MQLDTGVLEDPPHTPMVCPMEYRHQLCKDEDGTERFQKSAVFGQWGYNVTLLAQTPLER